MYARLQRLFLSETFARYLGASIAALACDVALFLLLLRAEIPPMAASAAAYMAGIIVHWILSTRFVFDSGMVARGIARTRQKGMFVVTALIGLAINTLIVGCGDLLGLDPRLAKLAAIAVSFQATYVARRTTIFRL